MDLKLIWNELRKDYRHFICIGITIIFLLLSIFYFKYAFGRLLETFTDIGTSFLYYVSELFEVDIHGNITVNEFTKMPFEMPFNLPSTWEEFKVLWNNMWTLFFTWENFVNYLVSFVDLLYYVSRILIIVLPFVLVLVIYKMTRKQVTNNDYNVESKHLTRWKKIVEDKIYLPIKNWILEFIDFLNKNDIYKKLWLLIWLYNFNIISIIIEFIAYYLYIVSSFDFVSLYTQFIKLLFDMSIMLDFFPGVIWLIIILLIINKIRRNIGYNKLEHMEHMNRGFINERPIITMVCGTMGKKKTTLLTDMALSKEIIFRNKAFELLLECDLEFPNFPWINLENTIKLLMAEHKIYNLASCKYYLNFFKECFYLSKIDKYTYKSIKRHLKKKYHLNFDNLLFGYDYERYGLKYDNKLYLIDLWKTLEDYAQLYFIYVIESSLLISNYSIRTDNILNDLGNFPLWNTDLFNRDSRYLDAYSRHAHIIDYDSLRLGKKIIDNNKNYLEFGVHVVTEIGKERKNNLELNEIKKNDESANQKNDLFNSNLKMIRHSATVRNFPFVWFGCDEQRPESWGADARDLCDIIYIDECSHFNICMPLFSIGDLILNWFKNLFKSSYTNYRFTRGDNTLPMYLYHNLAFKLNNYQKSIYNTFGFYKLKIQIEKGTQDGEVKETYYYLMTKKIYSKRFSTDCFSEVFINKALNSPIGINDLIEFKTEKATLEEMMLENSYFFSDLTKIKDN